MASASASALAVFTCLWIFAVEVSSDVFVITVQPGDTVHLPCRGPPRHKGSVLFVQWKKEGTIICRNRNPTENDLCEKEMLPPSLQNRVQLNNSFVEHGATSLTLTDVRRSDAGSYRCDISVSEPVVYCTVGEITSVLLTVQQDETSVAAKAGVTVTLTCQDPIVAHFKSVTWKRATESICFSQDFKKSYDCNRGIRRRPFWLWISLENNWATNGELSLVLTNVIRSDGGRYQCFVGHTDFGKQHNRDHQALICSVHLTVEPEVTNISAKPGDNVTLPCRGPENAGTLTVEWRRENDTICLSRNVEDHNRCEEDTVPPSFQNRVRLNHAGVNRDVSLILDGVKPSDTGRYDCYVVQSGRRRRRGSADVVDDVISVVHLTVERGELRRGSGALSP